MKNRALFFMVLAISVSSNISFAQNSILAGKIVEENNKPIPGAEIKLIKEHSELLNLKADADGLYCSKLMEQGTYRLAIYTDGKYLNSAKIVLDENSGSKFFYIVRVSGKKVRVEKTEEDPSIKVKLAKIRDGKHNDVPGDHVFIIKVDSVTGKPKSIQGPASGAPKAY